MSHQAVSSLETSLSLRENVYGSRTSFSNAHLNHRVSDTRPLDCEDDLAPRRLRLPSAELSLSNVTDAEVLPNLLEQTRRRIIEISGDGAYDTRDCHDAIRFKRAIPLIPPREGAAFWENGHPRNLAVGCQKLYGSNNKWKKRYGYHKRSLSETAMYRVKQLFGGRLSLRNYNAQVGETYAMIKALDKLTGLGMPEHSVLYKNYSIAGILVLWPNYATKP